jgi:hypothetical protein
MLHVVSVWIGRLHGRQLVLLPHHPVLFYSTVLYDILLYTTILNYIYTIGSRNTVHSLLRAGCVSSADCVKSVAGSRKKEADPPVKGQSICTVKPCKHLVRTKCLHGFTVQILCPLTKYLLSYNCDVGSPVREHAVGWNRFPVWYGWKKGWYWVISQTRERFSSF